MTREITASLLFVGIALSSSVLRPPFASTQDVARCVPEEALGAQTLPAGYRLTASVLDVAEGLASDGRGAYVNGADGIASPGVFGSWALNLFTWAGTEVITNRVRSGYDGPPPGRALRFDLSRPVSGSGAVSLGTVTDSGSRFHVFWRDLADVRTPVPILLMRVRDTVVVDRVEMFLRAGGHQYVLQLGPWTMGRYSNRGGSMHGEGTARATAERPSYERWVVRSAPGSIARLWLFDDPQKPEDRGLYYFSFAVQFDCAG